MFLKVENVNIHLGKFHLKNINLEIEKGEYVTIIGPSGSGKSILLEHIAGFFVPTTGKVILRGEDITHKEIEKRNISIVYQDYVLFPHMTVRDNILYGLKKKSKNKENNIKDVEEISKMLNIFHLLDRMPTTLSGGEMQRTSIARALVVKPDLLLMDEAFSALDVNLKQSMRKLIKEATKKFNTTVLHVTHDFEDVWSVSDKSIVLRYGEIMQVGKSEEIFSRPNSDFVAGFVDSNILSAKVVKSDDETTKLKFNGFELKTYDKAEIGSDVAVAIRPEHIRIVESNYENSIEAIIDSIKKKGTYLEMNVRSKNDSIKIHITPNAVGNFNVSEVIYLSIDPEKISLY